MVRDQLQARGIRSTDVLRIMGEVPRERFVKIGLMEQAYADEPLDLSQGQTISQPFMVAVMTEALSLSREDRVLEIGTGSGYQTAVLTRLANSVFTVERIESLAWKAKLTLRDLGFRNFEIQVTDGTLGWPEKAPYDGILVTAGAPGIPPSLKEQLSPDGGRLVVPVGDRAIQDLIRVTRNGDTFKEEKLLSCRFVPLLGAEGWEAPGPRRDPEASNSE